MIFQLFYQIRKQFSKGPLRWLILISFWVFILFGIFTVAFKYAEEVSFEEAIWQAWQTFTTVGYGNRPAETTLGRIITIIFSTLGIAFLGALFSASFDYKQYLIHKKQSGQMSNPFTDGYVIFNFPGISTTINLINELRIVEKNVGICIVDARLEKLPESISQLGKVHFLKGETLNKATYEKAHLKENKAVIVFPFESHRTESDGATKTTIDLVAKFVGNQTRILHVLVDPKNSWMFDDSPSTQILGELEVLAIVQECQDKYSAVIIEKLLLNTQGANPNTVQPQKIIGWTWEQLVLQSMRVCRKHNVHVNFLALVSKGVSNACPSLDTVIQEGDIISLLTYHRLDWKHFEEELLKVE
ncbi:potassium channel family protein [Rapidithrix thailandica]|uniref:Potassium channel family protein n=1 Tax=Rapidithrix thailandica TaxID=413964 RepID=A0AAW9S4V1_9BACT